MDGLTRGKRKRIPRISERGGDGRKKGWLAHKQQLVVTQQSLKDANVALLAPEPALAGRQYTASLYQSYNVLLPSQPVASRWKRRSTNRDVIWCSYVQFVFTAHTRSAYGECDEHQKRRHRWAWHGLTNGLSQNGYGEWQWPTKQPRFHCWFKLGPFCSMWIPTMT